MTDRELMQMALDWADEHLRVIYGMGGATTVSRMTEWTAVFRARLAQPEPEPVAWVAYENGEKHGIDFDEDEIAELPVGTMLYPIPPNFLDPAKVARLMDEAFERGKKEIDMEQVKDIAQKLADCALLNSAPPQREWQGLTDEEMMMIYGQSHEGKKYSLGRAIEAKLKEKNA